GALVVVTAQGKLLHVVLALRALGRLADLLHRGQQQADENGDDGNHHQQLDQRKRRSSHGRGAHAVPPQDQNVIVGQTRTREKRKGHNQRGRQQAVEAYPTCLVLPPRRRPRGEKKWWSDPDPRNPAVVPIMRKILIIASEL